MIVNNLPKLDITNLSSLISAFNVEDDQMCEFNMCFFSDSCFDTLIGDNSILTITARTLYTLKLFIIL